MYTSCPECGTVFRISTNELRVAEGFVRCGHCSATFNAIATLTDETPPTEPTSEPDPAPAQEPEPEPDRLPGFPAEPVAPPAPPELQAAATWVPLPVSDDTLEFDIPEDNWSNFFDASAPPPPAPEPEPEPEPFVAMEIADEEPPAADPPVAKDVGAGIGSDTVDQAGLYKALAAEAGQNPEDDADWRALLAEVRDDEGAAPEPVYVIGETGSPPEDLPLPDIAWDELAPEDTRAPAPLPADFAPHMPESARADDVTDHIGQDLPDRGPGLGDRPFVWEPPAPPPGDKQRHWGYTAGSVLATLLLLIQLVHQQRDELATHPSLSGPLQRAYAAAGLSLWPAWDLRSYELRSSEAVADRSSPGALDILGRIVVVGNDRVGLPLVRVTLRDRFAESLGSRVFQPAEYLGRNPPPREPLSPGTLIPVEISLKDPGRDAQGFDVDVCVMSRRDGIVCRGDREPFAR